MIQNIQYIFHSLLQPKYKIIINIIIYALIYISINNVQIASCMMEGNEIPQIAEAKEQASHQVQALKKEITDFAGTQIALLEEINELKAICETKDITIQQQQQKITFLQRDACFNQEHTEQMMERLYELSNRYSLSIKEYNNLVEEKNNKIEDLESTLQKIESICKEKRR